MTALLLINLRKVSIGLAKVNGVEKNDGLFLPPHNITYNFSWTHVLLQERSVHFALDSSHVVCSATYYWGSYTPSCSWRMYNLWSSSSSHEPQWDWCFLKEFADSNSWSAVHWHLPYRCLSVSLSPTLVNIWWCLSSNTNNKNVCVACFTVDTHNFRKCVQLCHISKFGILP